MERKRVIVVGSGPNGLAAAIVMARAGHDVVVREAADRVGGGTRTEELTLPGFLHDICAAVHPMAAASPFFRELALEEYGLAWVHPPVLMAHPFDDGSAAALYRSVEATVEGLGSDDENAWRRLMEPFVVRWRAVVEDTLAPPLRFPRRPLLMAGFARNGLRSALGLATSRLVSKRAHALFAGIAAHGLLPLDRSPSAAFGLMLALTGHAAGWPFARGGSQRIAEALSAILAEHGGIIETRAAVTSLDGFRRAPAVLLDLTPRQVLAVAGDALPRRYARQLRAWRYGPGVFKVDWALSAPIPWTAPECARAGTIHLGPSATDIASSLDAAWKGRHEERPFVILAQPTRFDPSRAPTGRHTAWAYCHVPHASRLDRTDAIERQVERFAPGFRDTILARHTMGPASLEEHDANLVGGAINGGIQDLRQFLFRPVPRLDPYSTPLDRVFVCSAATPPGGAVHGMCGFWAARSALRRLGAASGAVRRSSRRRASPGV